MDRSHKCFLSQYCVIMQSCILHTYIRNRAHTFDIRHRYTLMATIFLCWYRWHISHIHHFAGGIGKVNTTSQMTNFLCCFWMKSCLIFLDYGASLPERVCLSNNSAAEKSVESQVPAISISCSCQRWLAYTLYKSWLCDVRILCIILKPSAIVSLQCIYTATFLWPQYSGCTYIEYTT